MSIFDSMFRTRYQEPDMVVPMGENLNNYVYLDADSQSFNIFKNISDFIAMEFTKSIMSFKGDMANKQQLSYLLNLKPNDNQTANQMLYAFAHGLLKRGFVWYKVTTPPGGKMPSEIEISEINKTGFTQFLYPQIKIKVPSDILDKYTDLLANVSTKNSSGAIEVNSNLSAKLQDDKDGQNKAMRDRLQVIANQIRKFGLFFTVHSETTKLHQNVTQPDATALKDLKELIYEHLHISESLLAGDYTEAQYRAFYSTYIKPISMAFEELLNAELLSANDYKNGAKISVIMDLLQFATLSDFTTFANKATYNGWIKNDDVREALGKEPYEDDLGQVIFTNKNAVAINNKEVNDTILGVSSNSDTTSGNEDPNDNSKE